ncbi:MAG: four helix bundle protein [Chitinophagaceae bacterium]|nr:four helix bundle protein [Chitinophagaceae bacterium]
MENRNIVVEKSLDFGVEIVKFCEQLDEKRKYVVSKQLLRSGTSVGANVFEAQHAESKADFIHKMKIAIKEANETLYWLFICERSENYPVNSSLKQMVEELIRIISKIIISSKGKLGGRLSIGIVFVSSLVILR